MSGCAVLKFSQLIVGESLATPTEGKKWCNAERGLPLRCGGVAGGEEEKEEVVNCANEQCEGQQYKQVCAVLN